MPTNSTETPLTTFKLCLGVVSQKCNSSSEKGFIILQNLMFSKWAQNVNETRFRLPNTIGIHLIYNKTYNKAMFCVQKHYVPRLGKLGSVRFKVKRSTSFVSPESSCLKGKSSDIIKASKRQICKDSLLDRLQSALPIAEKQK